MRRRAGAFGERVVTTVALVGRPGSGGVLAVEAAVGRGEEAVGEQPIPWSLLSALV